MTLHAVHYNGGQIWIDKNTLPTKIEKGIFGVNGKSEFNIDNPKHIALLVSFYGKHIIYAQSTNLSLPNILYVEIEEDGKDWSLDSAKDFALTFIKGTAKKYPKGGHVTTDLIKHVLIAGVECGYKYGTKASAKKYTEGGVRRAFFSKPFIGFKRIVAADGDYKKAEENVFQEFIQSLQPKVVSIEVEMEYQNQDGNWSLYYPFASSAKDERPVTYIKDGKTFLKVKKVNYDNSSTF